MTKLDHKQIAKLLILNARACAALRYGKKYDELPKCSEIALHHLKAEYELMLKMCGIEISE